MGDIELLQIILTIQLLLGGGLLRNHETAATKSTKPHLRGCDAVLEYKPLVIKPASTKSTKVDLVHFVGVTSVALLVGFL